VSTKHRVGKTHLEVSEISVRCATLGNLYREVSSEMAEAGFDTAWDAGLRYFDTVPFYGLGLRETRVGARWRSTRVMSMFSRVPLAADENEHHCPTAMEGGYNALDELRSSGAISAFGLGVNEVEVCVDAMQFGHWECFLLAGRYTLLDQVGLHDFLPDCVEARTSILLGGNDTLVQKAYERLMLVAETFLDRENGTQYLRRASTDWDVNVTIDAQA
jgi:aryl-alcohol dehydrogenase-like predicted oxidoreductase